jgi:hypothetical protein
MHPRLVFFLVLVTSVPAIAANPFPGAAEALVFPVLCFLVFFVPLLLVTIKAINVKNVACRVREAASPYPWRELAPSILIFVLCFILWGFNIPRRAVFAVSLSGFEEIVRSGKPPGDSQHDLHQSAGAYTIDSYANDERGGLYFCTATGGDGLGPDMKSYGFVLHPNGTGTPYGNARYKLSHMFGDWYSFEASDDY